MSFSELHSDIAAFRHYLQSERGLSDNTVQAYGRDLDRFTKWCGLVRYTEYTAPTLRDLGRYLSFLHDEQLAPPSIARHLVALKMFYRFLRMEERADAAAVDLLGSPKLWERIPQVLPPNAVEELLNAPQPGDRFYLRDRALLETLYATGCRASEVVGLKLADVYLDAAFCRCFGKGSKQRVVPLGRPAIAALRAYVNESKVQRAEGGDLLFVSRVGPAANPYFPLGAGEEVLQASGVATHGQSAHAAAQLRDPPACRRRGPSHCPGITRPRLDPDHPALHPR